MAFELQFAEEDQDIANIIDGINNNVEGSWTFDANLIDVNKVADYAIQAADYYNAHLDEMDGADQEKYDNLQLLNLCVQLRANYGDAGQASSSDLRSFLMMELAEKFLTQKEQINHLNNNFISDGELPTAQDVLPEDILFPNGYPVRLYDKIVFDKNQLDFFEAYIEKSSEYQTGSDYQPFPFLEEKLDDLEPAEYTALIQLTPIYNGLAELLNSNTPKMKEINAGIAEGKAYSAKEIRSAYLNDIELGLLPIANKAVVTSEPVVQQQHEMVLPEELVFNPEIEALLDRLDPSSEFDEATRWHLDANNIPLDTLQHDSKLAMLWVQNGREVDEVKLNNLQMLNFCMNGRQSFIPEVQAEIKDLRTYYMLNLSKAHFFNPNVKEANAHFEATGELMSTGLPFIVDENEICTMEKMKLFEEHIKTTYDEQDNPDFTDKSPDDFIAIIVDEEKLAPFDATDIASQANLGMVYLGLLKILSTGGPNVTKIKQDMMGDEENDKPGKGFSPRKIWQAAQDDQKLALAAKNNADTTPRPATQNKAKAAPFIDATPLAAPLNKPKLVFDVQTEEFLNRFDPKSDTYDKKTMWHIDIREITSGVIHAMNEADKHRHDPKFVANKEKYSDLIATGDFVDAAYNIKYPEPVKDIRSYYMMGIVKKFFFDPKVDFYNERFKETGELPEADFSSEASKEKYDNLSYNYQDIILMSAHLQETYQKQTTPNFNSETYRPILVDESMLEHFTGKDVKNLGTLSKVYNAVNEMLKSPTPRVQKMYGEMQQGKKVNLQTIWQNYHDDHHAPSAHVAQNLNEVVKPELPQKPKQEKPKVITPIYNYVVTPKKPGQ